MTEQPPDRTNDEAPAPPGESDAEWVEVTTGEPNTFEPEEDAAPNTVAHSGDQHSGDQHSGDQEGDAD